MPGVRGFIPFRDNPLQQVSQMFAFAAPRRSNLVLADVLAPEANSFALARVGLAVALLVSQSYWLSSGDAALEPLARITGHSLGEYAVACFFMLSGLLAMRSLDRRRDVPAFLAARSVRIFPALVVCVLVTACIVAPAMSLLRVSDYFAHPQVVAYVAKTAVLLSGNEPLPGVFDRVPVHGLVNPALWMLGYLVASCAVLALLGASGLLAQRRAAAVVVGLAVLGLAGLALLSEPGAAVGSADNLRHLTLLFALGVLAYLVRDELPVNAMLLLPLGASALIASETPLAELTTALLLGYACLVVGAVDFGVPSRLARENGLAYGIFLYSCPVQQALMQLYPGAGPLELSAAALAVVVPLAGLSWTCVEQPAMGLLRRRGEPTDADHGATRDTADVSGVATIVAGALATRGAEAVWSEPALATLPPAAPAFHLSLVPSAPSTLAQARVADAAMAAPPRPPHRKARLRLVSSQDVVPIRASDMQHLAEMNGWSMHRRRRYWRPGSRILADVSRYAPTRRARLRGLAPPQRHRGQSSAAYEIVG